MNGVNVNNILKYILIFFSVFLVTLGTYLPWIPFSPLYHGPKPTSFSGINAGYQILDIPILLTYFISVYLLIRKKKTNPSSILIFSFLFLSLSFTLYHSFHATGSISNLRWGYHLTIFGIIVMFSAFIANRFFYDKSDSILYN